MVEGIRGRERMTHTRRHQQHKFLRNINIRGPDCIECCYISYKTVATHGFVPWFMLPTRTSRLMFFYFKNVRPVYAAMTTTPGKTMFLSQRFGRSNISGRSTGAGASLQRLDYDLRSFAKQYLQERRSLSVTEIRYSLTFTQPIFSFFFFFWFL